MFPQFRSPEREDFGAECKRRFILHCEAAKAAPFHKDKRVYIAKAWAEVDAFLDWQEIQAL